MIREKYSDQVHTNEVLEVLSLSGTPACLLDLRHQTVLLNSEMQGTLQVNGSEFTFSNWILSFPQASQKEVHHVLHRLLTEGLKELSVKVSFQKQLCRYLCKLVHLTNGQIVFTIQTIIQESPQTDVVNNPFIETEEGGEPLDHSLSNLYNRHASFFPNDKPLLNNYQLNETIDKFPHGLAVVSHNWDIMYANQKMEDLTGFPLKDNFNRKLWDLYKIEDYYHFFQNFLRAMETQETVEFEGYLLDKNIILQLTVHPTDLGLTVFAQDVTEYKQKLQALKESEERFAILANNIKDVFWIADPGFKQIHYISPSFQSLFGMSRREIFSDPENILKVIYPEDQKKLRAGAILMKNQKHQVEYRVKMDNGEERWIQTKGFPVENNGVSYVIGIHEDITECKEMERLKEKSRQLSTITQMSAGIAHEIKNPLTAIKGFLQIGAANPELRDNYQEIILDEVNRIEAIVQDFMMLSKPKSSLQQEEVDPEAIINYVLRLLSPEADEKEVTLNFDAKQIRGPIYTEPKRLNQILINLIKNAIDAVEVGGKVTVNAELSTSELTLSVSDNGPGLTAQELAKIGEPFFTTKEKGTGLGVMVTKKIVGDLNGTISYKSEKGKGTLVSVRLPKY